MPSTSRTRNYSEFVRIQTTAMPVRKWCHFASPTMPLRRLRRRAHNPHHWSRVECDCWHRFSWTVEITNVIEGEDNGRKEKVSNSLQCWERATIHELIETDLFTGWWLIYTRPIGRTNCLCWITRRFSWECFHRRCDSRESIRPGDHHFVLQT